MALFEHVMLLKQDLSSADLESEIKNHEEIISELNGNIVSKESWGLRNLAYPIKNNKKENKGKTPGLSPVLLAPVFRGLNRQASRHALTH